MAIVVTAIMVKFAKSWTTAVLQLNLPKQMEEFSSHQSFQSLTSFQARHYLSLSFSFPVSCTNTPVLILDNILNRLEASAIFVAAVFSKA